MHTLHRTICTACLVMHSQWRTKVCKLQQLLRKRSAKCFSIQDGPRQAAHMARGLGKQRQPILQKPPCPTQHAHPLPAMAAVICAVLGRVSFQPKAVATTVQLTTSTTPCCGMFQLCPGSTPYHAVHHTTTMLTACIMHIKHVTDTHQHHSIPCIRSLLGRGKKPPAHDPPLKRPCTPLLGGTRCSNATT